MAGRSYKTEAIVLRSLRFGEADRVLHLYTLDRGRVGAVAKGIRRTKSRFGGRLEPLSHVELVLHEGRGELQTITGVQLLRSHSAARDRHYRLSVGFVGLEAMLRLFPEQEANERAFGALARFLDLLDEVEPVDTRPALDPPVLAFQLKLLWLSVGNRDPLQRYNRDLHTYLQEAGVPHSWRLDTNGHDTAEMSSSLYHFAQKLFKE